MNDENITTCLAYMSGKSAERVKELQAHCVYTQARVYIRVNGRDGAMEIAGKLVIPENSTIPEWNTLEAQILAVSEMNDDLRIRYFMQ